jgi:magnesium chelatase family protein
MSLAIAKCISLIGLNGSVIDVEADIGIGLPGFTLLGLPDAALSESRDRVRAALINSGETWPNKRVTISLSPAWLPKRGSGFDLAIAAALLAASDAAPMDRLNNVIILGELTLEGKIKGILGILPALMAAKKAGFEKAIVPLVNAQEAGLVSGLEILAMSSLKECALWIRTGETLTHSFTENYVEKNGSEELDLSEVGGQLQARKALEISAIGGHHLLMIGPPGAGKTMLAARLPSILPPLDREGALEVTALHSLAGKVSHDSPLITQPPFVAPHHSATRAALVGGGGVNIKPGACSLAHNGVLFLDEAPEMSSGVLDALRQPLESGSITISRSGASANFPSRFTLVLAANPCPCGRFTGTGRNCSCTPQSVRRYLNKLSGPLLDRIDLQVEVGATGRAGLSQIGESSEVVRARVMNARSIAAIRFSNYYWKSNSLIPAKYLRTEFAPETAGVLFLNRALDRELITARAFHRIIRVGWSIADLHQHPIPTLSDIEEATKLHERSFV